MTFPEQCKSLAIKYGERWNGTSNVKASSLTRVKVAIDGMGFLYRLQGGCRKWIDIVDSFFRMMVTESGNPDVVVVCLDIPQVPGKDGHRLYVSQTRRAASDKTTENRVRKAFREEAGPFPVTEKKRKGRKAASEDGEEVEDGEEGDDPEDLRDAIRVALETSEAAARYMADVTYGNLDTAPFPQPHSGDFTALLKDRQWKSAVFLPFLLKHLEGDAKYSRHLGQAGVRLFLHGFRSPELLGEAGAPDQIPSKSKSYGCLLELTPDRGLVPSLEFDGRVSMLTPEGDFSSASFARAFILEGGDSVVQLRSLDGDVIPIGILIAQKTLLPLGSESTGRVEFQVIHGREDATVYDMRSVCLQIQNEMLTRYRILDVHNEEECYSANSPNSFLYTVREHAAVIFVCCLFLGSNDYCSKVSYITPEALYESIPAFFHSSRNETVRGIFRGHDPENEGQEFRRAVSYLQRTHPGNFNLLGKQDADGAFSINTSAFLALYKQAASATKWDLATSAKPARRTRKNSPLNLYAVLATLAHLNWTLRYFSSEVDPRSDVPPIEHSPDQYGYTRSPDGKEIIRLSKIFPQ